jgi:carboxylesterase
MMAGRLAFTVLGLVATASTAYPSWTRMRALQREGRQEWDATGVRSGSAAFTVGAGSTAVLFVHGFASSPSIFRFMAPALAEQGYACRAMRLPGFAERLDRMHAVDEARWRDAVAAEVTALRSTHQQVWIVGHSMGGTLALDYALEHPGQLDGLVLIAPLIKVSTRRSLGLPSQSLFRFARHVLPADAILGTAFPVDLNARGEGIDESRDRFLPIAMYDAMFRMTDRVRARAPELDLPVLMVLPGRDKVVSRRAARAYFEGLGSGRKQVFHAPRSGHVVPLDYGWNEVVRQIDAFARAGEGT